MSQLFKPWPPERRCQFCGKPITGKSTKKFCNTGCKDSFHNAEKARKNSNTYSYETVMRQNEKHLKVLSANAYYQQNGISEGPLLGQGVNLSVCVNEEVHLKTGGVIYWYGCYGVELPTKVGGNYMLHQRDESKVPNFKLGGGNYV
ncbi:hypothetical protein [Paracnuella aquatica]|uniref:hypothetical protein n=1 Tax=Paracnuella aquatica TaxID=2268757 RepID=UPI000DEFC237|nr:hypothetical protein [Paracnuella aquatica]RPD43646.1 hypothetical protein DRJ53_19535 [Paracnuella aquatica]